MGSAVISGGRVLRGAHGAAGEIGHISVDPAGMVCGCGGRGCVETFASETSIARRYAMAAKQAILAEEVIAKATAGEPAAARVWGDALGALATVIATAVALVDCELVVLAGTMGLPSVALAPLGDLLAQRINLVQLPRVMVGALGGRRRTPRRGGRRLRAQQRGPSGIRMAELEAVRRRTPPDRRRRLRLAAPWAGARSDRLSLPAKCEPEPEPRRLSTSATVGPETAPCAVP